ncbi:hypothetical protein LCGC14_1138480 [marine sediment metagenome]|uniref:Uncharacterized protein n=1 Tax=marine sediment metagenome TaxID=412755 RepID=A0A0F9Q4S0_9ZZZZ
MTILAIAFGVLLVVAVAASYYLFDRMEVRHQQDRHELQERNDALTEALVRAEGKPLVFGSKTDVLIPSPGWFDHKPQVVVKRKEDGTSGAS